MALTTGMIHGLIMMFSFGWLLPMGVLSARLMKHRPGDLWFRLHRGFQVAGLIFGIGGFAIAVRNFNVFADGSGTTSFQHGCLGATVFALVLLQPLLALLFRPGKSDDSTTNSSSGSRWWWELQHKGMGYLILLLTFVTILLGAKLEGTGWQLAYIFGVVGSLVLVAGLMWFDRFSYQPPTAPDATEMPSIA
ncbi:and DOMON domain-containing protein [Seminavis robusta]|uniref:And DOMON domain-containing protein n=1 Tax=Seminavis robusta TaxID=568900 RepID=A0A9N8E0R4_9STRA|nr:and DOMON domain-containing protein [Seminavis robusta]|eukprot:Sro534_g161720.1 and DOMON domain-containing protein (192) ;mRNA; r:4302-4877